jgi:predicted MFS family arabinose efflux permease
VNRPEPVLPEPPSERPSTRAWMLLALMTALNVLNFVDRQLIASVAPLIMADLGLSRAQIGLLVGFAFVIVYTLLGMVLGVAADRWSRRWLIAGGLAVWSAATAVSGVARGFLGLAVPRSVMGVGQATLTPAALSMLGDVFPARRLGVATGVYYAGLPMGTALSLIVAGWVAPRFGWRACFWVFGLLGLLAVAGVCAMREPQRRERAAASTAPVSTRAIVRDLLGALRERPAMGLVMVGGAGLAYASAAATHGVTWLVQERGFAFADAAVTAGIMAVVSGLAGNVAGGWLADWCGRRWRGGRAWSLALLTAFFAPFSIAFYLLPPSTPLFHVCWIISAASTVAYFGPVFSAIQELAPGHVRSSAVAFGLLTLNLLGVGPGPWITGLIGDRVNLTAGLLVSVGVTVAAIGPFVLAARLTPADPASFSRSA